MGVSSELSNDKDSGSPESEFFREFVAPTLNSDCCSLRLASASAIVARSGADLLALFPTLTPQIRPSEMDTELGRRGRTIGGLVSVGIWPEEGILVVDGQHFDASHAAEVRGPAFGQANMQSSVLVIEPLLGSPPPVSTNSG